MKLRVEVMDEGVEKDKFGSDLDEMEHLVREGVAYARSMDSSTEATCRVNLDAFLDSLVFDYQDSGARLNATAAAVPCWRPARMRCAGYW